MDTTPQDQELTDRLRQMTDTIGGPVPTDAMIRRGRTKVRRTRAIGTAAALSVLGTAGAFGAASGLIGQQEEPTHVTEAASAPSAFSTSNVVTQPVTPNARQPS